MYLSINKGWHPENPIFSQNNWFSFFPNLLMMHGWGFYSYHTFNPPSWSISTEFGAYLIFAAGTFAYAVGKSRGLFYIVLATISGCYILTQPEGLALGHQKSLIRCIFGFFCGCLSYYAYLNWPRVHLNYARKISAVIFIALIIFLATVTARHWQIVMIGITMLLVIYSALADTLSPVKNRFFKYLGDISYSIYMVHFFIAWIVENILKFVGHYPSVNDVLMCGNWIGTIIIPFYAAATIIAAHILYNLIEEPSRKWSKTYNPFAKAAVVKG